MSGRLKEVATNAPPIHGTTLEPILIFLENNVRKPLEGTWFDTWIASPAKVYYITAKRKD